MDGFQKRKTGYPLYKFHDMVRILIQAYSDFGRRLCNFYVNIYIKIAKLLQNIKKALNKKSGSR
jgi:hypothetical protein